MNHDQASVDMEAHSAPTGLQVVIVGPPGVGKTSVGRAFATRCGLDFVDVDRFVEQRQGRAIAEIFAEQGEAGFREIELSATCELLDRAGVIALGGGAVTNPRIRELLSGRVVIWLDESVDEGVARVGSSTHRPLLRGDVTEHLRTLITEREQFYRAVASHRIDTDGLSTGEVARLVEEQLGAQLYAGGQLNTAHFDTDHPYDVVIEHGALECLRDQLEGTSQVAIFHPHVLASAASRAGKLVQEAGAMPLLVELPEGESAKTPAVLAECWSRLARAGFTRSDLVVGLGGGASTDLAGFVAATWLRGVRWVSVPTTILAMVDAGIGGKTGADLPEGKNLVGAFWEPSGVLEDLDLLAGLPTVEVRSGLAEVIKHGFIADERTLDLIEQDPTDAADVASARLHELIARSVGVKARVVSADLRESTSMGDHVGREQLNYGHTLGHAIEASEHFTRRHGECVALGMVFAAELSQRVLSLDPAVVARHRRILASVGLATSYHGTSWPVLRELMARDKKTRGHTLRFVGLRDQGRVAMIVNPPEQALQEAFAALGGQSD